MSIDDLAKMSKALADLIAVLIWPVGIGVFLYIFADQIKAFMASISELTFKGGGIEWSAKRKTEAAAALGAAIGKQPDVHPEVIAQQTSLVSSIVDSVSARSVRGAMDATVLWVDDHPGNNINERRSLEALGVTFVIAKSTEEALEAVQRQPFQAIISDLGRGAESMAGLTLLEKLRAAGNMTPYILYAGARGLTVKEEAKQKGAFGVTNRPDELFQWVVSAIR